MMKIDFGCGTNLKDGYTGVEINAQKVMLCKKKGWKVVEGDVTKKLPFEDKSADVIRIKEVIEHLPHPQAFDMLQEAQRIIKYGGEIRVYTLFARKSFWYSFNHVKPYPPQALIKLMDGRETYKRINLYVHKIIYRRKYWVWPVGYWAILKKY